MRLAAWFDPRGRSSRRAYGRLVVRLLLMAAALYCVAIGLAAQGWREAAFGTLGGMAAVWLASLAQTIRRLHDRGRTGWWVSLSLVLAALNYVPVETEADAYPVAVVSYTLVTVVAALWFLFETFGRRGTPGPNVYGPEPIEGDR